MQGRKKELLRWVMLEEHSLAVGVSLVWGKTSKLVGGVATPTGKDSNVNAAVNSDGLWKPAMVLARSALELVTVRQFLHEDEDGNLFAAMDGEGRGGGKPDDRWALASFFGEEQHALLRLRDETRDLLVDLVATEDKDHGVDGSLDAVTAPATPGDGCGGESTTTAKLTG